jgi:hypothetical protein
MSGLRRYFRSDVVVAFWLGAGLATLAVITRGGW